MDPLNQTASQILDAQRQSLAEAIVARQYALQSELWQPYGQPGRDKSVRDAAYHLAYLSQAIAAADPPLFMDYINWVGELFAGLDMPAETLVATLACTVEVVQEQFPPELAATVQPYLEAGLVQVRTQSQPKPSFLQPDAPLAELADQYLTALRRGKRHTASQLILGAVEAGRSVKEIYLHVFQPAQYEIGRLWQTNQVSVAEEHYFTAATQMIMSQLYPYIFSTERIGRRLVATCVGGELHEIGIRMVTDFFEMEGWDTYYLGANTPAASILQTIVERQADILAISATMTFHVSAVSDLIRRVRATSSGRQVKILVGGYPFNISDGLWQKVGANGFARHAEAAITIAKQSVSAERSDEHSL